MLVLRTSNFPGATIRPTGLRRNHSIVFTVHRFSSARKFQNLVELFSTVFDKA